MIEITICIALLWQLYSDWSPWIRQYLNTTGLECGSKNILKCSWKGWSWWTAIMISLYDVLVTTPILVQLYMHKFAIVLRQTSCFILVRLFQFGDTGMTCFGSTKIRYCAICQFQDTGDMFYVYQVNWGNIMNWTTERKRNCTTSKQWLATKVNLRIRTVVPILTLLVIVGFVQKMSHRNQV
jgi:hypothetical protein